MKKNPSVPSEDQSARTLAAANTVLPGSREEPNRLFAVSAATSVPAWRPVRRGLDVARVCRLAYEAGRCWTTPPSGWVVR